MNIMLVSLVAFLVIFYLTSNTIANSQQVDNWLDGPNELEYEDSHSILRNLQPQVSIPIYIKLPEDCKEQLRQMFDRGVVTVLSETSIYDKVPTGKKMASVNAGNHVLHLGVGKINQIFFKALMESGIDAIRIQQESIDAAKMSDHYHRDFTCIFAPSSVAALCTMGSKLKFRSKGSGYDFTGTTYIVQFRADESVYNNSDNRFMIYTAGPSSVTFFDIEEFRNALMTTIRTMWTTIAKWNRENKMEHIDVVRIPCISGGVNRHPDLSSDDVANIILEALAGEYKKDANAFENVSLQLHSSFQKVVGDLYMFDDTSTDTSTSTPTSA